MEEDSKNLASVGALVLRIELLEGSLQELRDSMKQQAAAAAKNESGAKSELTLDDVRGMTVDEVNKRWNEVQTALQKSKKGQ